MIQKSKQNWTIGQTVNVGFIRNLTVVRIDLTPGNYAPDDYILTTADGSKAYRFTPHLGLSRIDLSEAIAA